MTDIDIERMSLEQTRAAAQELLDGTTGDLAGADAERFQALTQRAEQIREQDRQRSTTRRDLLQRLASGDVMLESGSPSTRTATRTGHPACSSATQPRVFLTVPSPTTGLQPVAPSSSTA
jgi:hypothetical protein